MSTQCYYYPSNTNLPVIDSFMFHREESSKELTLLCFQITIASVHPTTGDKLEKFFVEELQARFQYQGGALELKISKDGLKLACGEGEFALNVHLIYTVRRTNMDSLKY